MPNLLTTAWAKAQRTTSQAAINSRVMREMLRWVIVASTLMLAFILVETASFIKAGQVTAVVGSLLATIFTLFVGILGAAGKALMTALNDADDKDNNRDIANDVRDIANDVRDVANDKRDAAARPLIIEDKNA